MSAFTPYRKLEPNKDAEEAKPEPEVLTSSTVIQQQTLHFPINLIFNMPARQDVYSLNYFDRRTVDAGKKNEQFLIRNILRRDSGRAVEDKLAVECGAVATHGAHGAGFVERAAQVEVLVSNLGRSLHGHRCIYCGKVYSRKYGLKIHIRTHTGYKPLKCKFCSRRFGDPSNLNKHVRLHAEGSTPYRCEFCSKVLVRRRDLERHIKSRHMAT